MTFQHTPYMYVYVQIEYLVEYRKQETIYDN
jgi:hypothetical protein